MVITRVIDFPDCKVTAMVIQDENGDDNIYINAKASIEMQRKGFKHELSHISNGDLDSSLTADEIEAIRHREENI